MGKQKNGVKKQWVFCTSKSQYCTCILVVWQCSPPVATREKSVFTKCTDFKQDELVVQNPVCKQALHLHSVLCSSCSTIRTLIVEPHFLLLFLSQLFWHCCKLRIASQMCCFLSVHSFTGSIDICIELEVLI